ncbi:SDR family oxidoreductase [bacterium]|nr:SDR family oxidoreductase [bacterium]
MQVKGKVFVVSGGGSGMGRELTLLLLKKGAMVAALDINETTLKETESLAGEYRGNLSLHVANITDRDAVLNLPEAVIQVHGAVDAIINNAGIIQPFVKIKDLEFKDIERVFNVNFWGLVNMTKAFLPYLLKRPEGHIINTSSMGGYLPVPGQTIYGASKAAVKLFTEGLHSELLDTNVHVTTVFPGAIATNISANSGVSSNSIQAEKAPKIKMTTAPVAAEIIVDGIEKNKYRVLVGSDAKMMDFLSRLMPERAAKIIYTQMRSLLAD